MSAGSFNSLLSSSEFAIGTFVKIPSPEVTEMVAKSGFTFVVIDSEHALLSVRDVYEMILSYSAFGVAALVRVTDHTYGDAQRYLDAGAAGVLVPHVSTASQAQTIAHQLLFPPLGTRGMGFNSRAGEWGRLPGGAQEYVRFGNCETMRIAMIEEPEAVANIDSILAVEGIDAIFIGPGDLSLAMGVPLDAPELAAAVDFAIERAVAAGKPVGTIANNGAQAAHRRDQGCAFVLLHSDTGIISSALASGFASVRAELRVRAQAMTENPI